MMTNDLVGQSLTAAKTSLVTCDDSAMAASALGRFRLQMLASRRESGW